MSKLRHSSREDGRVREANILPVMNIMFLLIPALLLSMEFASFSSITVSPPKFSSLQSEPGPTDTNPALKLSLFIRDDGFRLDSSETSVINRGSSSDPNEIRSDDLTGHNFSNHDFAKLEAKARELKSAYPKETVVTVSAMNNVSLATLTRSLDAMRGSGCRLWATDVDGPGADCMFYHPIIRSK